MPLQIDTIMCKPFDAWLATRFYHRHISGSLTDYIGDNCAIDEQPRMLKVDGGFPLFDLQMKVITTSEITVVALLYSY